MFGTVIIDAYRKEEIEEMANAIDDLCSPTDSCGGASSRNILFLGLLCRGNSVYRMWATWQRDLSNIMGFCQLKRVQSKNKLKNIFRKNERLGYTMLYSHRYPNH